MKTKFLTLIPFLLWVIGTMPVKADAPAGVQMVDLGLPSGILWANMNVGATSPEGYGDYFAWGETQGYTGNTGDGRSFDWPSYKWCNGSSSSMTKYCTNSSDGTVDNKTTLEPADDAAHVNWGGNWRMPTDAEWTELRTQCSWTWTAQNGVNGYRVTATNGNSIFLPAAGYRGTYLGGAGADGYYWSSSLYTNYSGYAYYVPFDSSDVDRYGSDRSGGNSVRAVCPTPSPTTYPITFLGATGETLQSSEVAEGEMPEYTGATPTKAEDTNYTYEFSGWSPAIVAATTAATYTAQFTALPKHYQLTDGVAYTNTYEYTCESITYTRTFNNTQWQALYVPFSMQYEDWADDFEVAKIVSFHPYDDNNDGEEDRTILEAFRLTSGATVPNRPYLIRLKQTESTGEKTITSTNTTLHAAADNSISCSTTEMLYIFQGTYSRYTVGANEYALSNGQLLKPSGAVNLKPMRWYLRMESKDPSVVPPAQIAIQLIGEEEEVEEGITTAIDVLPVEAATAPIGVYTTDGRLITMIDSMAEIYLLHLPAGIYVANGNRVFVP